MTGVQQSDLDVFKDIPGYRAILKAVLKNQIQILVEQLSSQTGEESVILTASVNDGTLSHLGSEFGKVFLQDHEEIKTQFLGFCLKSYHKRKTPEYLPQAKRFAAAKRHSPDFSQSQDSSSDILYTGTPEVSYEESTIHPVIMSKSVSKSRNLDSKSHIDHHKSPASSSKKREVSKSRNLHSISNLNHQTLTASSQAQNSFQSEEPSDSLGSSFVEKDLRIPRQSADLNHSIYNKNVPIIVKTEAVDYEELSQEPAEMVVEDFGKQTAESLSETLGSETASDKSNVNIKLEKEDDVEIIGEDMLETSSQGGEYPYSSSDSQPNFGNMSGADGMGLGADGQQYNFMPIATGYGSGSSGYPFIRGSLFSTRRRGFSDEALISAIEAVKAHTMNRFTAAKTFGVPKSTLFRIIDADGTIRGNYKC